MRMRRHCEPASLHKSSEIDIFHTPKRDYIIIFKIGSGANARNIVIALVPNFQVTIFLCCLPGSITARLAGTVFYTTSFLALVLSWRLSAKWEKISNEWAALERKTNNVPADTKLKTRMIVVLIVVFSLAARELTRRFRAFVEIFWLPLITTSWKPQLTPLA